MPNIGQVIDLLVKMNPQAANNPQAQHWLNIVRNGDAAQGQEVANNICQSMGVDRDTAVEQAASFFNQFKV